LIQVFWYSKLRGTHRGRSSTVLTIDSNRQFRGIERERVTMAPNYSPAEPLITHLVYEDGVERLYEPMFALDDEEGKRKVRHSPSFGMPGGVIPTADSLLLLFFPDELIDQMVRSTNAYAKKKETPARLQPVDSSDVLRFLAIYYYIGIVKLPCKRDYWREPGTFWPTHPTCLTLTRRRFEYIWRYLHLTEQDVLIEEDIEVDEEVEGIDRLDGEANDDEDEEILEDPSADPQDGWIVSDMYAIIDERWYGKVGILIDHVNKVSQLLCKHPGSVCSIDEMMKRFKGRSSQTARMKNKPSKEGYKFFSLCDASTGYVYNFIPDGRLVHTTIADTVLTLVESLPLRTQLEYIVGMDNYFTYPKVLHGMRQLNVGCIGTARAKRGWPPKEMREIDDIRFNTLYLMNDEKDFKIARWIDNNVVTMVSTVHTGEESIERVRRKPRPTAVNRRHLELVWGGNPVRAIHIPCMIDDYNHWMGGVDKADQLIAYYRPNLRCRRVWMPLMMHALDILRVNAFVIAKSANDRLVHKDFIVSLIKGLLERASYSHMRETRARAATIRRSSPRSVQKKRRMSSSNPSLPHYRLNGKPEDHQMVHGGKQRACTYCSYLRSLSIGAGTPKEDLPKVKTITRYCSACKDSLCIQHFKVFHSGGVASI
jgi:hypothetical protein